MSLFQASTTEGFSFAIGESTVISPANESRLFLELTVVAGSNCWVRRSSLVEKGKGIFLTGVGSSFRCDDWRGDISVISEGQTIISGEIGYL